MRISDLAVTSGIPIPTIKFYLREGLLPTGQTTAPNQARYTDEHLRRLRLIRVLVEIGGLKLEAVKRVLEAIEGDEPLHGTLAAAHAALPVRDREGGAEVASARVETDAWLATLDWDLGADNPSRDDLASALLALRRVGWKVGPEVFGRYAEHADALAADEIAYVALDEDRAEAVERTVVGTVVFERALAALRRLAQEHHSRRRFGAG